MQDGLDALGVNVILPSSGFAAGVRVIRDIEDNLFYLMGRTVDHRPHILNNRRKERLYHYLLNLRLDESFNKYEQWLGALPEQGTRDVPSRDAFMSGFNDADEPVSGVLWLKKEQERRLKVPPWEKDVWTPFDENLYNRADDLLDKAYDLSGRDMLISRVWDILDISPYCVDAYNLLADESDVLDEKMYFSEKGVQAGRMMFGDAFIRENTGRFWMDIETRPFMRALKGYADRLRDVGMRERAIGAYEELLRLNPGDHQGNRYDLSACLLEDGRDDTMRLLMARYGDENSCFISYDKALWTFRVTGGANERSNEMLAEALGVNGHVPSFILRERPVPYRLPEYYGLGDEDEAAIYAANSRKAWDQTPGALEWLRDVRRPAGE
jgi:tetratricopeptide (TPR) repeat protein